MSLRKMLRVSLLMLLAMALAATSAHARLDLFGQLLTSKNQPKPNSVVTGDDKQVVLWTKAKLDAIPYEECINTCNGLCVCTLPWPPELAICVCMLPIKPEAAGKVIPTKTAGNDKQVVLWTEAKLDSIPYEECINTCKGLCACTLPWPPEFAICVCMLPIKPEAAGKAIPTKTVVVTGNDKQVVLWTEAKLDSIPYEECINTCKGLCACTLPWPPELAVCVCMLPIKPEAAGKAIPTKIAEVVEESHKKLDSLPKPVATSGGGGFIPYPECIEKCDECVICTKIYPIEKALCYCGKNTASNSNKPAIQNLGDDKKVVLWTQAKLHPIPYEECIQTCEEFCACNIPRPPISPTCICIPISAGRALPI